MDAVALLASLSVAGAVGLVAFIIVGARGASATDRLQSYTAVRQEPIQNEAQRREQQASLRSLVAHSAALGAFNRVVERRSWSDDMARSLARADLALTPGEFVVIRIVVVGATVGAFLLLSPVLPSLGTPPALLGALVLGFQLPRMYIGRRQAKRLRAFNDALADTITLIANALRSGSSFLQSIELVVRETQPPVSTEFSRIVREVSLGRPLEQALQNLVRRVASDDLELMTTAVSIQYQVGGNLAEILDTIAFTIRERVRIKGEIRTLTAQQRLSGYVVGFLPVGLIVIISLIAPTFMAPMFESPPEVFGLPLGVIMLAFGGVMMVIGFAFIRRIVNIRV